MPPGRGEPDAQAPAAPVEPAGRGADQGQADGRGGGPSARPGSGSAGGGAGSAETLGLARPTPGHREPVPPEYGPYLSSFRRRVQEALSYPLAARRLGLSGAVEIEMLIDPSGRLRSVEVVSSSSHAVLDQAAVDAVRKIEPLPLPADLPPRPLRVRLPLIFQLR